MSLLTIFQIDVSLAMIIALAFIHYFWIRKLHKKPKRQQFSNYQDQSVYDTGRKQLEQLFSKRLSPPITS